MCQQPHDNKENVSENEVEELVWVRAKRTYAPKKVELHDDDIAQSLYPEVWEQQLKKEKRRKKKRKRRIRIRTVTINLYITCEWI